MKRRWLFLIALVLLLALFPMRLAVAALDSNNLVGVRAASGTIWAGRLVGVTVGEMPLGDFSARLSPLALLAGRAELALVSLADRRAQGRIYSGFAAQGVRNVEASLAGNGAFAPLPVETVSLRAASVRFTEAGCAEASGQMRVELRGKVAGLDMNRTMIGPLKCDGKALTALLVSGSAMERIVLRAEAGGNYAIRLIVRPPDPQTAAALSLLGFRDTPQGLEAGLNGRF